MNMKNNERVKGLVKILKQKTDLKNVVVLPVVDKKQKVKSK